MQKINLIITVLIFLFLPDFSKSIENKVLVKVNNEIITTIDIYNEIRFLKSLNSFTNLENFNQSELIEAAKKSLIKEKIKEIYLKKVFKNLDLNEADFVRILLSAYSQVEIKNFEELTIYLSKFSINPDNLRKKLAINTFWNEQIVKKYSSNVKINKDEIKNELLNNNMQIEFNISEILFIANKSEISQKYNLIKNSIKDKGFNNSAIIFSKSDTSSNGGLIGWVKESSINKKILEEINSISIGEISKPILVPGGFLILRINDKRQIEKFESIDEEINSIVEFKRNDQLNRFSNIFFQKIEKDITINEL